jgi:hypothetical protein
MTAKPRPKPKRPKIEDPDQSRRFFEAAADIEAAGGLSPTEAELEMERTFTSVVSSAKPRAPKGP